MADFVPAGTILPFAADDTTTLSGWHICNGDAMAKDQYADLFAAIGYANGGQDNLFYLPDLRGRFLRGK